MDVRNDHNPDAGRTDLVFVYGIIVLLLLAMFRVIPFEAMLPACVFRAIIGIPCPACGTTRALAHLAAGELSAALRMNPLAALTVITVIGVFALRCIAVVSGRRYLPFQVPERAISCLRYVIPALILLNWLAIIAVPEILQ